MNKSIFPTLLFMVPLSVFSQNNLEKLEPVSFSRVTITDDFWKPRIDRIATATLPACIYQTEIATPRIQNFINAAKKKKGSFKGLVYDDSDVFKALEAMSYSLKDNPDPALERKADEWIDIIAAAQMPDGYLNTYYELTDINKRWTEIPNHEDYNAGHLIEAAVAYYNSTGKRKLLDVAIRYANHIDSTFRLQNRHWISGHEEIELALVKLYHATGNDRYLKLADWYLQQRGTGTRMGWFTPEYWQDVKPVKEQTRITGHAVRAMYLYTGAADVAAATGDSGYMNAMKKVWQDVVYRNMYITGGIGSSGDNEGFTTDYDLPNQDAYCETCASVGMVLWNKRMNLLTGDSKYVDVLERSLYNGALDGLSLSGDRFFYGNPLTSLGGYGRSEWFGTACCPANIARLVASLGDYIYAKSAGSIYVNLFVGSRTTIPLGTTTVTIEQQTNYPWDGDVTLHLTPSSTATFSLMVRIPGWAKNEPVPGNAYYYFRPGAQTFTLQVNGRNADYTLQNGYAVINRKWKAGDSVHLHLPMEVHRMIAIDSIQADAGRVALERGPLMYCIEQADNSNILNVLLPDSASFHTEYLPSKLGGIVQITAAARAIVPADDSSAVREVPQPVDFIPYYSWANRGQGAMQMWLPRKIMALRFDGK